MGWGCWKDRVEGGVGDGVPGVGVVVKPNPRFLDEDDICCFVCKVEEGVHNIGRFCCIVLDEVNGLVGPV